MTRRSDGGAGCGRRVPAPVRVPGGHPRDQDPVPDDPRHRGHVGSQRPHCRHLRSVSVTLYTQALYYSDCSALVHSVNPVKT